MQQTFSLRSFHFRIPMALPRASMNKPFGLDENSDTWVSYLIFGAAEAFRL